MVEGVKETLVYKIDIYSNFSAKDFTPKYKNAAAVHKDTELCSYTRDEAEKLCLHRSSDTCGESVSFIMQGQCLSRFLGIFDENVSGFLV